MNQEREPLMTFDELAVELGVTRNALVRLLGFDKSDTKPKPVFGKKRARTPSGTVRYYRPSEMRKWFYSRKPANINNAVDLLRSRGYTVIEPAEHS